MSDLTVAIRNEIRARQPRPIAANARQTVTKIEVGWLSTSMTGRMSKITFRADDDLVAQLEAFDASKSEVMREALRTYLEDGDRQPSDSEPEPEPASAEESLDDLIVERVDAVLADRLGERRQPQPQDVNVNISLEDAVASQSATPTTSDAEESTDTVTERGTERTCSQCGETVSDDHVYCPNCGEKAARRVFCECGDELRSDWSFCPSCGRRTAAADVLDP